MGRLIFHCDGRVASLQLSHPGKANAIDATMLNELDAALTAIEADAAIRVVVLRGSPGGPFSSGADVDAWAPMPPAAFARDWIERGNAIFDRFEALRCPTVAAIDGVCLGGGLELALCADLRLAAPAARFRFPEVAIGAFPGWQGGPRLARVVGRGRALQAVLTACEIDAPTALAWGLVNAVAGPDGLDGNAATGTQGLDARAAAGAHGLDALLAATVDTLARVSPQAAALAKAAVVGDDDARSFYPAAAAAIKASRDAEIGLRAFRARTVATF